MTIQGLLKFCEQMIAIGEGHQMLWDYDNPTFAITGISPKMYTDENGDRYAKYYFELDEVKE